MPSLHWFRFHLGTALLTSLVASVLLGANLAWQSELLPMSISIGRGNVSQPVQAFFSPSYRGWPLRWDPDSPDFLHAVTVNAAAALGVLILTAFFSELLIRRGTRMRQSTGAEGRMPFGLPPLLITALWIIGLAAVLAWLNFVLHPDGAFAVRGWPFPYQSFLRADAVVTRDTLDYWDTAQRNATAYAALDAITALALVVGLPFLARWWIRRPR